MRPDEHKRRKNERYKKKHSMASGSEKENEANLKSKKSESKDVKQPTEERKQNAGASKLGVQTDDKEEAPRRLPDNWDRYEEIEEDEFMPEIRGEDFNKLIADSVGSASRFRFKDEEDWIDETSESEKPNQGLTMDFDNLTQAINCIPLFERLDLSKDLFNDEQLEEMTRTAKECRIKYEEVNQNSEKIEKDSEPASKLKDVPKLTKTKQDTSVPSITNKPVKAQPENNNLQSNSLTSGMRTDINSLEDDLDSLLSNDTPSMNHTIVKEEPSLQKPPKETNAEVLHKVKSENYKKDNSPSTEDWLDELLGD